MALIIFYQNNKNIKEQKKQDLISLEHKVLDSYNYILNQKDYNNEDLKKIMKQRVNELANIFNTTISLYDLQGNFITSNTNDSRPMNKKILLDLKQNGGRVLIDSMTHQKDIGILSSYNFLKKKNEPIAVINIHYLLNYSSTVYQSRVLVKQFLLLLIFLMILSGLISWYLSTSMTSKIEEVAEKLSDTNVVYNNQPIEYNYNDEIRPLVIAYNNMLEKLKEQTHLLQKTEREEAWKEMAKQVAHEINNPLTPLRLTVQNFQRKYHPGDPENEEKIKFLTKSIVHQIDLISSITKSFSDFANMPINLDKEIEMVDTIKKILSIFPEEVVHFQSNVQSLYYTIDSLYLTRVITNIVKNGIQSIPDSKIKKIDVNLLSENKKILITIEDNGKGIPEEYKEKIFQPKFSTKKSGMGLGLSMVKKIVEDYRGKIWFSSRPNEGTQFNIEFYIE